MSQVPRQLSRSLSWDQGSEMCPTTCRAPRPPAWTSTCGPHSAWQRGSNENNGLLGEGFPEGSDLSKWGAGYLDTVAARSGRLAAALAFGAAALLYLAVEELLVEAHEQTETALLGAMFFAGFLAIYVLAELGG